MIIIQAFPVMSMIQYWFSISGWIRIDIGCEFRTSTVAAYNTIQIRPVAILSQFQKFVSINNLSTIVIMITVKATLLVNQCSGVSPVGSIAPRIPY